MLRHRVVRYYHYIVHNWHDARAYGSSLWSYSQSSLLLYGVSVLTFCVSWSFIERSCSHGDYDWLLLLSATTGSCAFAWWRYQQEEASGKKSEASHIADLRQGYKGQASSSNNHNKKDVREKAHYLYYYYYTTTTQYYYYKYCYSCYYYGVR